MSPVYTGGPGGFISYDNQPPNDRFARYEATEE